ncbi:hypothetical protein L3Q67_36185 [Saccharothrix sp. AJ9571]|nr:hypothetical protein L3Q67_36185 [Saccharothrix sp. AJ9571]
MIRTWLLNRLKPQRDESAVTMELACGGRIRLRARDDGSSIELTSPPDGQRGPCTTRLELSVAEITELRAALDAASREHSVTA